MPRTGATSNSSALLCLAGILLVATIPLRLVETVFRQKFMSDYYGSFWEALTNDMWFSEAWWDYVGTPLGLTMSLAPILAIVGAVACFFAATKTWSPVG